MSGCTLCKGKHICKRVSGYYRIAGHKSKLYAVTWIPPPCIMQKKYYRKEEKAL